MFTKPGSLAPQIWDYGLGTRFPLAAPFTGTDTSASLILDFQRQVYGVQAAGGTMPALSSFGALVTFTRASTAMYFDGTGVMRQAASNAPRFDCDPFTAQSLGLLIEEARTNLLLQSANFSAAAWFGSASGTGVAPVVTANFGVAPDGTTSTGKLVFSCPAGGDISTLSQSVTTVATSVYSSGIWLRAATAGDIGKIIGHRQTAGGSFTLVTLTAAFQRIGSVETAVGTASSFDIVLRPAVGTSSGTVNVEAWGAQLELGPFRTSDIPTTTSQQTRAADLASVGTLSPWYNGAAQTLFAKYKQYAGITADAFIASFAPVAAGSYIAINGVAGTKSGWFASGPASTALALGSTHKQAITDAGTAFTQCGDGGTVFSSAASDYTGTATSLSIGQKAAATFANGWIAQLKYFPSVFSNANLQVLTT